MSSAQGVESIQFQWDFGIEEWLPTSETEKKTQKKNDSHNSSKLCENVGISTSALVQKCHYQADMVLNLNSTSLFGKSSAEERIKVLIKLHARGGFYVYIPAMILSPLLFFCRLPFYFFFPAWVRSSSSCSDTSWPRCSSVIRELTWAV